MIYSSTVYFKIGTLAAKRAESADSLFFYQRKSAFRFAGVQKGFCTVEKIYKNILLQLHTEWIEIRVPVVNIFVFGAFEKIDNRVGDGSHQGFHADFENVIREGEREEQTPRENIESRSDDDKNNCVDKFANQRTADGT